MKKTPTGFTLIESLLVVAVIAAILVLLMPMFSSISEKSKAATCLANMRQLSALLLHYAQENRERPGYLPFSYDLSTPNVPVLWAQKLRDTELLGPKALDVSLSARGNILYCPGSRVKWNNYSDWMRGHYTLNTSLAGAQAGAGVYPFIPISLRSLERPSRVIMLLDGGAYSLAYSHVVNPQLAVWYLPGDPRNANIGWSDSNRDDAVSGRHAKRINVCFADGHIESLTASDIRSEHFWNPNATVTP